MSAAVAGAAGGSALGGALSDFLGRKKALLAGDVLFTAGALLMAAAPDVAVIIAGMCGLPLSGLPCVIHGLTSLGPLKIPVFGRCSAAVRRS